eukprot:TRINITY_DN8007_c0_g1_i17.p2 TRINITY_DN8007_c0_g1~~TRINITY_DN8007_c0_g1_i17.p2  ORF type:complete len:354 (-),score=38.56 TRINITY_DN8007_c0_g1_i17:128-1189(-)
MKIINYQSKTPFSTSSKAHKKSSQDAEPHKFPINILNLYNTTKNNFLNKTRKIENNAQMNIINGVKKVCNTSMKLSCANVKDKHEQMIEEDFKRYVEEVEKRFRKSETNGVYAFPRKGKESAAESYVSSAENRVVSIYEDNAHSGVNTAAKKARSQERNPRSLKTNSNLCSILHSLLAKGDQRKKPKSYSKMSFYNTQAIDFNRLPKTTIGIYAGDNYKIQGVRFCSKPQRQYTFHSEESKANEQAKANHSFIEISGKSVTRNVRGHTRTHTYNNREIKGYYKLASEFRPVKDAKHQKSKTGSNIKIIKEHSSKQRKRNVDLYTANKISLTGKVRGRTLLTNTLNVGKIFKNF